MVLSKLLSTKEREKILGEILFKREDIKVVDVAKQLKLSKGFVSRFFFVLVQQKIIRKLKKKYIIADNLSVRLLRISFNLKQFTNFNFRKYPFVTGVGLYGSCARGDNFEDSDIDVWIKVDFRNEEMLAKLTSDLKKKYRKISPLYLTKDKLNILKKEDVPFFHSLVLGSIRIYGENID